MHEKPPIPEEAIISRLEEQYGLEVTGITFLPIGADTGSVVYRVLTQEDYLLSSQVKKRVYRDRGDRSAPSQIAGDSRDHYSVRNKY